MITALEVEKTMSNKYFKFDTPEDFYRMIPKDLGENLNFRQEFIVETVGKDKELQKIIKQFCYFDVKIFFNAFAWSLNPQMPPSMRNWPLILRPKQEIVVDTVKWGIDNQKDIGLNKTRKEGATEIIAKIYTCYSLVVPDCNFLMASEKEDKVEKTGDKYTLFSKIDHTLNCLPYWWKPKFIDNHLQMTFLDTGSTIHGEATNPNFGASGRATSVFLDEFGRVDRNIAESMEGTIHDVSDCVIYGSTHWLGRNHPFNKALEKKTTKVVTLLWYENPVKNYGLYKSPEIDQIEIVDIDYYRDLCPEIFNEIEPNIQFKYSEFEKSLLTYPEKIQEKLRDIKFIADGCENIPGDLRSPWHDYEEEKRRGNKRDLISNIWASPIGSSDAVFDDIILNRIKNSYIRPPNFVGDILFSYNSTGRVINPKIKKSKYGKLRWWGKLKNGTVNPAHNFIIGIDPGLGTGSSNSTAIIVDRNINEQVGEYITSSHPPQEFADICVALGRWCNNAYLIWENNGGHGINFGRRVKWNGYNSVYIQRQEANKTIKPQNKYGWHSNRESKADLLGELGIALSEGLKTKRSYKSLIIHSEELLDELFDYMYLEGGDIEASVRADLTSGARQRHGDRVIGAALCVLGLKYRAPAKIEERRKIPKNSVANRIEQWNKQQEEEKRHKRKFLF